MKSFTTCLTKDGTPKIITVKASDEAEAYLAIRRELNTSNRQYVFDQ